MKRWISVSFALGTFLGVILVTVFTFIRLQFGTLNVAASPVAAQPASGQTVSTQDGSFANAAAFFESKGITLSIAPSTPLSWAYWNTYDSTINPNIRAASSELQSEFSKYSDQALKNSGLKSIYLVKDLAVDGQARSGMPEPQLGHALYFDASDTYLQSEDGQYMRRTFHHEFSHLIEYDLFGSYAPEDAKWSGCNARGTTYGDGGSTMYSDPDFAHKMHPSYGFVDGYATSAPEEDKAEMFSFYMMDANYVQSLANKDAGVACKLAQTKNLIQRL